MLRILQRSLGFVAGLSMQMPALDGIWGVLKGSWEVLVLGCSWDLRLNMSA